MKGEKFPHAAGVKTNFYYMYSDKIEALINAALADGVLTDKERQILLKSAQAEGIDPDEFEMVLNARLYEINKVQQAAPKSNKMGDVCKCPACGAIVATGSAACVECGYAFNEYSGATAMDKLYERLQAIDDKYRNETVDLSNVLSGQIDPRLAKAKEKINAISIFNVPNTRSELLSLLTSIELLSDPKGPKNGWGIYDERLGYGYWVLYSNCINKAKISFANDPSFAPYFAKYDVMLVESKKFHLPPVVKLLLGLCGVLIVLFILLGILVNL